MVTSGAGGRMRRAWAPGILGAALPDGCRLRAVCVLALAAAAGLAGCASGNPNALAPKLVVDLRPEGGLTVFIHSAFGEHAYDSLSVRLDNATTRQRVSSFSLEESFPSEGFYLEVEASLEGETYAVRGRVDLGPDREHVQVAFVDAEDQWSDAREFSLPFERILERRDTP